MLASVKRTMNSLFAIAPHERLKVLFLTMSYLLIVASYTISREVKDTVFTAIVGSGSIPLARILSMVVLIVPLFFYAKLVDRLRRYQLLCVCALFYGIVGLIFTFFLGHPIIGMLNTNASSNRVFGWLFYFFIEGYSPFIVSVFWAFANSISDQKAAKENYGLIVAGSKMGGILGAVFSLSILSWTAPVIATRMNDVANQQILLGTASLMCLLIAGCVLMLMRKVPGCYLHGYEAAYKLEKERSRQGKSKTGIWSGLSMILKSPYVLGIFGLVIFYEIINMILSYQRVRVAEANTASLSEMSVFLYKSIFFVHVIGLFISVLGTRTLIEKLGEKRCLILVPTLYGLMLLYFMTSYTQYSFVFVYIMTKALHYGFSLPLRETLYIPTVKEIKFKSKAWIDSFGSKFARAFSSLFSYVVDLMGAAFFFPAHILIFAATVLTWFGVAYGLGYRFEAAVARDEVIGFEDLPDIEKVSESKKENVV